MFSLRRSHRNGTHGLNKMRATAGTRAGRGARGQRLRPSETAAAHELLEDDAVPNVRVWEMYDEAARFENEILMSLCDLLTELESSTEGFLLSVQPILRAPLPRVWDAVDGRLAEPTRATISHGHAHTVGGDASIAGLEEARSEWRSQVRGHLLRPLEQWSEVLRVVEERLPELQRLRSIVVKHSRSLMRSSQRYKRRMELEQRGGGAVGGGGGMRGLFGVCVRPRAGSSSSASALPRRHGSAGIGDGSIGSQDQSDEEDDDEAVRRQVRMVASEEAGMELNYKHRKLQAARADYDETERLVAAELEGLCRDAAWLKSYAIAALALGKEALQVAVVSLGNTKQPVPGFTMRGPHVPLRDYGVLGDNMALAAMMPERASRPSAAALPRGAAEALLPPGGVHAHRATATPMELAARPDANALDWVEAPARGAAAVPLEAVQSAVPVISGAAPAAGLALPAAQGAPAAPVKAAAAQATAAPAGASGLPGATAPAGAPPPLLAAPAAPAPAPAPAAALSHSREVVTGQPAVTMAATRNPADISAARQGGGGGGGEDGVLLAAGTKAAAGAAAQLGTAAGEQGGVAVVQQPSSSSSSSSSSEEDQKEDVFVDSRDDAAAGYGLDQHTPRVGESRPTRPDLMIPGGGVLCDDSTQQGVGLVQDNAVVKERVTRVVEHRPVEKMYEAQLRYTGEKALPVIADAEGVVHERVV